MIWLIGILIFIIVVAATWFMGLWNNLITLINFFIASLVACSFFEILTNTINLQDDSFRRIAPFISIWLIFVLTFMFLRLVTDVGSNFRLKFDIVTEMIGRSVLSIWLAGAFTCFVFFTLHMAPLPESYFETENREIGGFFTQPKSVGFGPDRLWCAFIQSRSRGALSESRTTTLFPEMKGDPHPDDPQDVRVFDPNATYFEGFSWMRDALAKDTQLRVGK